MGIKQLLKTAFPKPIMPQKRYLVGMALIIYGIAKGIAYLTPSEVDDGYVDKVKDAVMLIVHNNDDEDAS